jgi:hypothetical protein
VLITCQAWGMDGERLPSGKIHQSSQGRDFSPPRAGRNFLGTAENRKNLIDQRGLTPAIKTVRVASKRNDSATRRAEAQLNQRWRIVVAPDGTHWILQRLQRAPDKKARTKEDGECRQRTGSWQPRRERRR